MSTHAIFTSQVLCQNSNSSKLIDTSFIGRKHTHSYITQSHYIKLFGGEIRKFIRYKFDENCKSLSYLSDYIIKQAMVGSEFQFVHQFLQACECNFMAH